MKNINDKLKLLNLLELAKNEYNNSNLGDAEKHCKEILLLNSQDATALRGLGCIMRQKNDFMNAEKYFLKALECSNKKEIEYTLLGSLFYEQKQLEKAIEYYNKAIEINDNYDEAYEGRNQAMLENHLDIVDFQENMIKREDI